MDSLLLIIFSYLLGSILFGEVIAKWKGVNIRSVGSGNVGATNVARVLGKRYAFIVFLLDTFKGLLPILLSRLYFGLDSWTTFFVGIAAVLGHMYSVFGNFKGGKGVATAFGILLGISPLVAILTLMFWFFVFKLKGYVSLASILSQPFAVVVLFLSQVPGKIVLMAILIGSFVIYKHRENIKRLMEGTELGFRR